jgi:hypothetical protein
MNYRHLNNWLVPLAAVVATWGVLSFYQPSNAQQKGPSQPFANAVQQRSEMVEHLKAIEALLTEQNDLLRSGKLRVIVGNSASK